MSETIWQVSARAAFVPSELGCHWRDRAIEALRATESESLLDLDCGGGIDSMLIAEHADVRVVALERDMLRVHEATRRSRHAAVDVRYALGDPRALPFADGSFDLVRIAKLESDDTPALMEITRVARKGVLVHEASEALGARLASVGFPMASDGVFIRAQGATA